MKRSLIKKKKKQGLPKTLSTSKDGGDFVWNMKKSIHLLGSVRGSGREVGEVSCARRKEGGGGEDLLSIQVKKLKNRGDGGSRVS